LLDLLGDLGGVTEVMLLLFNFFLLPISQHSFVVKMMKKLFIARTKDEDLFLKPRQIVKPKKTKLKYFQSKSVEEMQKK
jgi:hypothetical protein